MVTRQELHQLVDETPDAGLDDVRRYLAALKEAEGDAFLARLRLLPEDDEPLTPEEEAALAEAYGDLTAGRVVSLEQAKRELGL